MDKKGRQTQFRSFVKYFLSRFKYRKGMVRKIGIEKEILAIDASGQMADLSETVWPAVMKSKKYPLLFDDYYKNSLIGYKIGKDIVTTDAGLGTLEIILSPTESIGEAKRKMEICYRSISSFLDKAGYSMLGLGYQPITKASNKLWNRKQRYETIIKYFRDRVKFFSMSASDQVHIDFSPDEIMGAFLAFNKLNGFLIALFANSPIQNGHIGKELGYRETVWDKMGKKRTGSPKKETPSMESLLWTIWNTTCVMAKKGNEYFSPKKSFLEFVRGKSAKETQKQFRYHEGSVWFSSRPRLYGTLEIRPCCLQPFKADLSVSAFCLGLAEKLPELLILLERFSWKECYKLRYTASREGLYAKINGKPVLPILKELVEMSKNGLKKRAKNEEKYLKYVYLTLLKRENPAQEANRIFKSGGINALLKERRFLL